jgi:hypothetical protein
MLLKFSILHYDLNGSLYRLPVIMENVSCHGNVLTEPLASNGLPLCSLLRERVFGEPLASSGLPLWLRCSGFQASCHNMFEWPPLQEDWYVSQVSSITFY